MNTLNKVLYKCLTELGCDFNKFETCKEERIKIQKYSYLLEELYGIPITGSFTLYLNGPYNSKLQDILYLMIHEGLHPYKTAIEVKPLPNKTAKELVKLRSLFSEVEGFSEIDLLELFTTYDYLHVNFPSYTLQELMNELNRFNRALSIQHGRKKIEKTLREISVLLKRGYTK